MLTPKEFPPRQQLSTVKEGIPFYTLTVSRNFVWRFFASSFGGRVRRRTWSEDI